MKKKHKMIQVFAKVQESNVQLFMKLNINLQNSYQNIQSPCEHIIILHQFYKMILHFEDAGNKSRRYVL